MHLKPVETVQGLTRELFEEQFLKPKVPVIINDFVKDSPALKLWNYDYFRAQAGQLSVSVHGSEDTHVDKVASLPVSKMKFAQYLDLIESEPTELRLFLFNLLMEKPEFRQQLVVNKLTDNLLLSFPFMFFGGTGSSVRYHYDIDLSHVFLTQFQGEKKVWLFSKEQSDLLYRLPYNFHGIADLRHPDYEKFPALKSIVGWEATLTFGQTLFMPTGYWHYIQYVTHGYSVSHRALSSSYVDRLKGFRNILITRRFDTTMRKLFKEKWYDYKVQTAFSRAEKAMSRHESHQ